MIQPCISMLTGAGYICNKYIHKVGQRKHICEWISCWINDAFETGGPTWWSSRLGERSWGTIQTIRNIIDYIGRCQWPNAPKKKYRWTRVPAHKISTTEEYGTGTSKRLVTSLVIIVWNLINNLSTVYIIKTCLII